MASDIIQQSREAIVAVLDAYPPIQALTGRSSGNVVAWNPEAVVELPVIAYQFVTGPELAADGDTRELLFQFSASGEDESTAHELLGAVEQALSQLAFLALSPPFDAFVARSIRRGFDLDVTLRVCISAYPVASVVVSPSSATVELGSTQGFTADGFDAYGNSVPVTPSWSVDP